jgi:hypothetical protein
VRRFFCLRKRDDITEQRSVCMDALKLAFEEVAGAFPHCAQDWESLVGDSFGLE